MATIDEWIRGRGPKLEDFREVRFTPFGPVRIMCTLADGGRHCWADGATSFEALLKAFALEATQGNHSLVTRYREMLSFWSRQRQLGGGTLTEREESSWTELCDLVWMAMTEDQRDEADRKKNQPRLCGVVVDGVPCPLPHGHRDLFPHAEPAAETASPPEPAPCPFCGSADGCPWHDEIVVSVLGAESAGFPQLADALFRKGMAQAAQSQPGSSRARVAAFYEEAAQRKVTSGEECVLQALGAIPLELLRDWVAPFPEPLVSPPETLSDDQRRLYRLVMDAATARRQVAEAELYRRGEGPDPRERIGVLTMPERP